MKELQLQSTARLGRHLRAELNAILIDEHLLDGRHFQYRRFFISRWTYQFNTKARARVFAQYASDRHGNDLSINSLFAYDFTARSALLRRLQPPAPLALRRHRPRQPGVREALLPVCVLVDPRSS